MRNRTNPEQHKKRNNKGIKTKSGQKRKRKNTHKNARYRTIYGIKVQKYTTIVACRPDIKIKTFVFCV